MNISTSPAKVESRKKFSLPSPLVKRLYLCRSVVWVLAFCMLPAVATSQSLPANFSTQVIGSGWNQPVGLTFSPNGAVLFVWEKGGRVYTVVNGVKSSTPLLSISEEVGNWRDHGLVGFAVDPNFNASGGYIYLLYAVDRHHLLHFGTANYSVNTNEYFNATIGRLTRYTVTGSGSSWSVNTASRKVLLGESKSTGFPILHESHGAGCLAFGSDGTLLVSTGDGSSYNGVDVGAGTVGVNGYNANDSIAYIRTYAQQALADGIITTQENVGSFKAQLLTSLSGKVLRLDPATGNGVPSNPYYDAANPRSARSRVWALGFRNPYRMSRRPDTGSSLPSDGNPGVFYIGDVGFGEWEELSVINGPAQNFGWPLFEGLEANSAYPFKLTRNQTAPNPLANGGSCQPYFSFRDLIKQPVASGTVSFPNPCNTSQPIPAAYTFVHKRPILDWHHGSGPSRVGTFSGNVASVANVGAAGSPVSGAQFGGNAATAGVWYTGDDFPAQYKNTYFCADYGGGWIRNLQLDGLDNLQGVNNFVNSGLSVVCMASHPTQGGLYYIQYGGDPFVQEVRKVYFSGNYPPQAVASADKLYSPSPFTVNFTGSNSKDPEGGPITYRWDFGDGSAVSTAANPSHTFNAPAGVPTKFEVTLTVTDNKGATAEAKLVISVNNTPPVVKITSPVNNSKYSIDEPTIYNLTANVTDSEQGANGLTYQWQTILFHNNHNHPDPYDNNPTTTTEISPVGCDGESYFFRIVLTVTDAAGLSATDQVEIFPNCGTTTNCTASGTILREVWNNVPGVSVSTIPVNNTPSSSSQTTLFESPSNTGDNYGQRMRGYICAPATGNYTFWIASDNDGELWLSTDDNPANKRRIAYIQGGYAYPRQWDKLTTQKSAAIALVAGKRYYIEALHKEDAGGDNLAVGWQLPNGTQERPIPGNRLSPFLPVNNNTPPTVSLTAPANNATFTAGSNITISANAADANGSINKVEFFQGNTSLGVDNTAPYSIVWNNVPAGSYALKAVATDNANASTISSIVNITVNAPVNCTASGTILREVWNNVTGAGVAVIPVFNTPSSSSQVTLFETPSSVGDNYGQRIRGYVCVPTTGNYTFWIASDNDGELWLSTDDNPANKRRIAYIQNNFAYPRQWDKLTTQKSAAIALVAGRRYYIEALHKEEVGGDNLAVGWTLPNGTQERPIPGNRLSPFVPGNTGPTTCNTSGTILREVWNNVMGTGVSAIPVNNAPSSSSQATLFESPSNLGDNFGQRMRGYVCAPVSGNYTFWIASDNDGELWLSTSDSPANKRRIAYIQNNFAYPRQWDKLTTQKSATIALVAGQRYYIEALHKEGFGGDNLAVGWTLPNGTQERPIPGNRLSPFVPGNAKVTAEAEVVSTELSLPVLTAHPNPFSRKVTISFTSDETNTATLDLFDLWGNRTSQIYQGEAKKGEAVNIELDGVNLPEGMHIIRLTTGSKTVHHKIILAR